jgi:8-oxo-dGTP diphosphatase
LKKIDKLAWIQIDKGRILSTRSRGKDKYYIPGGKREPGESDIEALSREIEEELCVTLVPNSIKFFGVFEAQAHGQPDGTTVRMTCYTADHLGEYFANSEIEEIRWLSYSDQSEISYVDKLIFEDLKAKQLLE